MSDSATTHGRLSREEVVSKLKAQIAELLRLESVESVRAESRLVDDLGVDSLGMVDLVTLVEESFSVKLATNTDLTQIKTVGDVADLLTEHLAAKAQE